MKIISFSDQDTISILPETAIIRKGYPFFIPNIEEEWVLSLRLSVTIDRLGKAIQAKFANRYYNSIAIALKAEQKIAGTKATAIPEGFDSSIMISEKADFQEPFAFQITSLPSATDKGEIIWQRKEVLTYSKEKIDRAVEIGSRHFTLHTGDMLLLNVFSLSIPVVTDSRISIMNGGETILTHKIK